MEDTPDSPISKDRTLSLNVVSDLKAKCKSLRVENNASTSKVHDEQNLNCSALNVPTFDYDVTPHVSSTDPDLTHISPRQPLPKRTDSDTVQVGNSNANFFVRPKEDEFESLFKFHP